jgi:hypothetical protein
VKIATVEDLPPQAMRREYVDWITKAKRKNWKCEDC